MSDFKVDFIKDFLTEYPDKDILKSFIQSLPLSKQDKRFLIIRYCREDITPMKVVAYELDISERYAKALHKDIITRTLPYINLFFIKALNTSPLKDN